MKNFHQLEEHIWIGSAKVACDDIFLLANNITAIVRMDSKPLERMAKEIDYFECLVPSQEIGEMEYQRWFDKFDKILGTYVAELVGVRRNVLICCDDTLSRSLFGAMYYMIKGRRGNYRKIMNDMQKSFPDITCLNSHYTMLKVAGGEAIKTQFISR